jgi:hypothetical protein
VFPAHVGPGPGPGEHLGFVTSLTHFTASDDIHSHIDLCEVPRVNEVPRVLA